jgi:hypothetical protein
MTRTTHWSASLVPAAAVIPAPIAYIQDCCAVKRLVIEIVSCGVCLPIAVRQARLRGFSPVRCYRVRACAYYDYIALAVLTIAHHGILH